MTKQRYHKLDPCQDQYSDYYIIEPCTTSNGMEIKLKDLKINMENAEAAFSSLGTVAGSSSVVMLAKVGKYTISVYASGRMMVKEDKTTKSKKKEIDILAQKILRALETHDAIIRGKQ